MCVEFWVDFKFGRQGGSDSQKRNHKGSQAWAVAAAKSRRQAWETNLGDKAAAAAKSVIVKVNKLGRQGGSRSQKKCGKQGGSSTQKRKINIVNKAAAATKRKIMNRHKLRRQGGNGNQNGNHEGR